MMRQMTLSELEAPLRAHLVGPDREFGSVSIDSRRVGQGELFVALVGERFDGHDFLAQAEREGAVAALVSRDVETALPLLRVADTEQALGRLGGYNRALYRHPLVAITGSSGKTTVKNLVSAVLSQRGPTLATEGNLNNEIGVPLTLLRLHPEAAFAVVEMGAGKPGDIAWLCEIGRPTVSLLLNAMPAHLERMGSVEAVADTKGAIYDTLGEGDTAIINRDQPWAQDWQVRAGAARILDFGLSRAAAIGARDIRLLGAEGLQFVAITPAGELAVKLRLPGEHNVANALAAIAAGLACGLGLAEIGAGLASVEPVRGRLASRRAASGAVIIDDCYNANPGSVRAAIDLLASCPGHRALLLGAMRELGEQSEQLHSEIGAYARERGIEDFWGVGEELLPAVAAFGDRARWYADLEAAGAAAATAFGEGCTVLVKGSRSAGMEALLNPLLESGSTEEAGQC